MPTYTVTSANLVLSKRDKEKIAEAITQAHHSSTGAPGFFAQVIFRALEDGEHFIGGKQNPSPHIFIHGLIRAGRTEQVKQALMSDVLERLLRILPVGREDVWIYLQDIDAPQMLEFGRFLPEPGAEAEWRKGISSQKLADFSRAGVAA